MAFEYLAQYKSFDSITDMDKSVENHMAARYYDLTESERSIVFKLASHALEYPGVCHLKAVTIAAALEISTKTVYRAITKLESLGIIKKETTVKSKGGQGASIYIILPYNVSPSMSERVNAEKPCESRVEVQQYENQPSSSFYLFRSKQANNINSLGNELALQAEKKKAYMNEYQVMLLDLMHSLPLHDDLKDQLHKCILATKMNNKRDFVNAKDVLANILRDIANGTLTIASTLRAVFVGAYDKAVERLSVKPYKSLAVEENRHRERPVPFYNWLEQRDSLQR
ncbi:helix-turn-helix domain-containing protein [Lysinibacillus capsici]|uniref:helix-turn-helix domain-containing protein n=1 Tax=Lysinibacillus capsici TaxID=2115968 RepID=UPI0030819102|nr:helix-turn-helix domain-containing protein [Lysinibacillus capsici]